MKRIIAGGTGFIGQGLVKHWLHRDVTLYVLGRNKNKIKKIFGEKVVAISWSDFQKDPQSLLQNCDAIINLCGANIATKRWTDLYRQEILSSRLEPTLAIATACAKLGEKSPRLLNASAIGFYGIQEELADNLPPAFDENSIVNSQHDFLSQIAHLWEEATRIAKKSQVNVVNCRFAVVLDKSGGALPKLARPFYFFMGGRIGSGNQPFSWITLHDLCRIFDFILQHPEINGPINCVAPQTVKQLELAHALGRVLHRPSKITMPSNILKWFLGRDRATELLLKGQHVVPTRLTELGFQFDYPDIDSALRAIFLSPLPLAGEGGA